MQKAIPTTWWPPKDNGAEGILLYGATEDFTWAEDVLLPYEIGEPLGSHPFWERRTSPGGAGLPFRFQRRWWAIPKEARGIYGPI